MYTDRSHLLLALLALCMALGSCRHKPTMQEMGVVLDTLKAENHIALLEDSAGSPQCYVIVELITFGNKEYSSINDSLLRSGILSPDYLSLSDIHMTPQAAVDSFIQRYTSDYREIFTGIFSDEGDTEAATIGYTITTSIEEGKDSILTYKAFISNRQGAITTEYTHCLNIDLGRKRILGLSDVFVPGSEKGLQEAITSQLMKQTRCKTPEDLRTAGFFVNSEAYAPNNFILGDKTITFVYVAGEIADRSKGEIQVEVKYSDIRNLLKR
ncbi:MAG: DUF3298 domain-containing protein [Prevotella sp.]|nr:DUF3298 domain-containing protein [Prevotella sp.]